MTADDGEWTHGWSWDLPAKPLAEQRGPNRPDPGDDRSDRPRRTPFWRLRQRRSGDPVVSRSETSQAAIG